ANIIIGLHGRRVSRLPTGRTAARAPYARELRARSVGTGGLCRRNPPRDREARSRGPRGICPPPDVPRAVASAGRARPCRRAVPPAVAAGGGFSRFRGMDRRLDGSPPDDLPPPRAWPALPKFLSLDDVDRLIAQPDASTPRGLRDRAMLELLYATGLRVSELV